MLHHPELRERKSEERPDGIERDQFVRDAAKENQQQESQGAENHDAVAVNQAAAAMTESVRQIIVLRDGTAEARKIGERGVRGKRKNEENRDDSEVVKGTLAENRANQHRENALIAGLPRVGRNDTVALDEIRNSREKHRQNKNDDGQRVLRVLDGRLAEGLYAIADGFHASEGSAAAGKHFEQSQ